MVKAQGVNIDFMKVLALSLSNALVAFSGGLMAQFQGFADIKMGQGAIVIGLASVIIGEVIGEAVAGKHLSFFLRLVFVVLGGVIYYLVVGLVMWLKMPTDLLKLFTASIVAIFLAVPYLRGKSKNSFLFAQRKGGARNA
jgi:putative ABC transport system permease protein